ncbi:MAG: hypothetical protein ACYC05_15530 [Sulfuricella sp.]
MEKKLQQVLLALFLLPCLSWAGPIELQASSVPSQLKTALKSNVADEKLNTFVSCYNVADGTAVDCSYSFSIVGLAGDPANVDVNAGHTHDYATHPLGTAASPDGSGNAIAGQTKNGVVKIVHTLPIVSGKIKTQLDLNVPPGWYCVVPECLDSTRQGWRFNTTLSVGVSGLSLLPDPNGGSAYVKHRSPDDDHTDSNAYYGTNDTLFYLTSLATQYQMLTDHSLSINDMSLPKGGIFDISPKSTWLNPHALHRVGTSADINKTGGDCLKNKTLKQAVDTIMPPLSKSELLAIYPGLTSLPTHFRCETYNHNNIHIDFDMAFPK